MHGVWEGTAAFIEGKGQLARTLHVCGGRPPSGFSGDPLAPQTPGPPQACSPGGSKVASPGGLTDSSLPRRARDAHPWARSPAQHDSSARSSVLNPLMLLSRHLCTASAAADLPVAPASPPSRLVSKEKQGAATARESEVSTGKKKRLVVSQPQVEQ